jgi:DNA-binding MarR family transcriptional regulator
MVSVPSRDELPESARSFLIQRIESPDFLEVLLLLHGGGERSWAPHEVRRAMDLDDVTVNRALVSLRQSGILKVTIDDHDDVQYFYRPSPEAANTVDAVAERYREDPRGILELIATRPRQKLRLFADAFRIRGDRR